MDPAMALIPSFAQVRPFYSENTMKVTIEMPEGVIWMRDAGTNEGMASRGYIEDGARQKIIAALEEVLSQAKSEALCWNGAD